MYKTLFSTQKGTWDNKRKKNLLNNRSYCFERRVNYHHLSIFFRSLLSSTLCALPPLQLSPGQRGARPIAASVSQRERARVSE